VALQPAVHTGDPTFYRLLRWIGRLSLAISLLVAPKAEQPRAVRDELDLA
jgi:hypothetical protein